MSDPSATDSPTSAHATLASVREQASRLGISEADFLQMAEAVERGESFQDYTGLSPEVLNSFENVAVTLYGQHRYQDAENIFHLLLQLTDWARGSAWRGLGACRQVRLDYPGAIDAYRRAIVTDGSDLLSATYMAESMLLLGQREEAERVLEVLLEQAKQTGQLGEPHVRRAGALLEGTRQTPRVTPSASRAIDVSKARAGATEPGPAAAISVAEQGEARADGMDASVEMPPDPDVSDPEVRAFMERPHVREQLDQLSNMFANNQITLREIADYSQEQMDAGYAVCHMLLERQDYTNALQMCGWMIHIDGHDYRFYQLGGLAALGIQMHCLAEYLFAMAAIWSVDGPDAATLIYKAESHLLQGEIGEGLALVEEGLSKGQHRPEFHDVMQRGHLLKTHYANVPEGTEAAGDL